MNKPTGYDGATASTGGFQKPAAGAYICKIVQAIETTSKSSNRPMMVLLLDIAHGEFRDFFAKSFEFFKSKNPDAKWPLVHRRLMDEDAVSYLKGDISCIEQSNTGFVFNFDEKTLKGKLVGAMLGEKEYNFEGKTVLEPRWLLSTKRVTDGNLVIPKKKLFEGEHNVSESQNEPLPF